MSYPSWQDAGTIFAGNLMRGDIPGAFTGAMYPEQAMPHQTLTAAEQTHILKHDAGFTDKFLGWAMNIATDPVVLMGIMLSSRFPNFKWLKGEVPKRMRETALRTGFFSSMFRSMESVLFTAEPYTRQLSRAGTTRLLTKKREMVEAFMKGAAPLLADTKNSYKHRAITAMLLEGREAEIAGTKLGKVTKIHLDAARIQREVMEGGFDILGIPRNKHYGYVQNYLPHLTNYPGTRDWLNVDMKTGLPSFAQFKKHPKILALKEATKNWTLPIDSEGMGVIQSEFNPLYRGFGSEVFNEFGLKRKDLLKFPKDVLHPEQGEYVLDIFTIMNRYINRVARTYAFGTGLTAEEVRTFGLKTNTPIMKQLLDIRNSWPKVPQTKMIHKNMNEYVKQLMGGYNELDGILSNGWEAMKGKVFHSLDPFQNTAWGRKSQKWLEKTSLKDVGWRTVEDLLVRGTYSSALGLNARSTMHQLLQTSLTTAPSAGVYPTAVGVVKALKDYSKFVGMRLRGYTHEVSAKASFPKLRTLIDIDPVEFDLSESLGPLTDLKERSLLGLFKRFTKATMAPFTQGERFNRLAAYYASDYIYSQPDMIKRMSSLKGLQGKDLVAGIERLAGQFVVDTQFLPGLPSSSYYLSQLPPVVKQFTTFPLRFTSWMVESTYRGALSDKEMETASTFAKMFGGRQWGQVGRFAAGTGIVYAFLRDVLGVDASEGLGGGIIPTSPAGSPFSPLPIPPIPSMFINVGHAMVSGSTQPLMKVGRLSIPGGVALSRLSRWMFQYDDGRWTDNEGRVVREQPPAEALMETIGFPMINSRRERLAAKQVYQLRKNMRDLRRRYTHALIRVDPKEAGALSAQWTKAYPQLPPLQVSKADMKSAWLSSEKTHLQRLLNTGGRAMADVTGTVMIKELSKMLGGQSWGQLGFDTSSVPFTTLQSFSQPNYQNPQTPY